MPLSNIINQVIELTARPDARSKALIAVNAIIQDVCNNSDYPEDLIEVSILAPNPGSYTTTISLALPDSPPVKKIEYVLAGGLPQTLIKPRNAVTSTGCSPANTCYRAGSNLHINASAPIDVIKLGYYQQVGWLAENSSHWLEDVAPQLLVFGTVAAVFRATGDDASATEYEGQYRLARQQFRRMRVDSEEV